MRHGQFPFVLNSYQTVIANGQDHGKKTFNVEGAGSLLAAGSANRFSMVLIDTITKVDNQDFTLNPNLMKQHHH